MWLCFIGLPCCDRAGNARCKNTCRRVLVTSDKEEEIVDTLIQDCGAVNPTVSRQKKGGLRELREGGGRVLVTSDKEEEIVDTLIQDCGDVDPTVSRQKKGGLRELRGGGGNAGHVRQGGGDSGHSYTGLLRCQPHGELAEKKGARARR